MQSHVNYNEINVYVHTLYWIYRIQDTYWERLLNNFNKKMFYISSFKSNVIRKNDIVLIYMVHKTKYKSGFVGLCQVENDMQRNLKNIKIFNDNNMNKFCCELNKVFILDTVIKLTNIKDLLLGFNVRSFRRKFIGDNTLSLKLSTSLANDIIPIFTENIETSLQTQQNENENKTDDDTDETDDNVSIASNNTSDSDEIMVTIGHIPIMIKPCCNFIWSSDNEITIENFRHHYSRCNQCIKTDNNECSFLNHFNTSEIYCSHVVDCDEINKCLDYYHNLKKYPFDLIDNDKKYKHTMIYRINNRACLYHKCLIILW